MRQKYETEEKEVQNRMAQLEKEANTVADIKTKLEKEQLAHDTLKKNYETDKKLWELERDQLNSKLPPVLYIQRNTVFPLIV